MKLKTKTKVKQLDDLVSKFVRLRDSACVTCGDTTGTMQAGHFITRSRRSTRFDERNVHKQCVTCNLTYGGNPVEYYKFMKSKYGEDVIEELNLKSRQPAKYTREDYNNMIEYYKQKINELENE